MNTTGRQSESGKKIREREHEDDKMMTRRRQENAGGSKVDDLKKDYRKVTGKR